MQKHLLALLLLLISFTVVAQDWQWVQGTGGPDYCESRRIATDANGNSYVAGNFARSVKLGNTTYSGAPNGGGFLLKYDDSGNLVWSKILEGTSEVEAKDITADAAGNIYVTGNFKGTFTLGNIILASPEYLSAFIAKFDTNGNVVWAKNATSTYHHVRGVNITQDANGNSYVTGSFLNNASFGAISITATKDEQLFIAKYNASGDIVWVKIAGGFGSCLTYGITTDNSGNLYLAGHFWHTAVFGSTTLFKVDAIPAVGDLFIAKYDANGNALWARQAGGSGTDVAAGITTDNSGNSYITGFFYGTANFGSTSVTGSSERNFFIAKYNAAGTLQWAKKHEGTGNVVGVGIDKDSKGNIYTAGYFTGTATFGTTVLSAFGASDIFFAKHDANGNTTAAMQAGGTQVDEGRDLAVGKDDKIYFTGTFRGPATFGTATLANAGHYQVVTGKLNAVTSAPPVGPTIKTDALWSNLLCTGSKGRKDIYFSKTGNFDTGNVFTAQLSDAQGSFDSPIVIGTSTWTSIYVTIPTGTPPGAGYRIRVVSSSPAIIGSDNGTDLTVPVPLVQPGPIGGKIEPCGGTAGWVYEVEPVPGAENYDWAVPFGWSITGGQGTARITVTAGTSAGNVSVMASNKCEYTSWRSLKVTPFNFTVGTYVTTSSIFDGAATFLRAWGADTYSWSPTTGLSNPNIADPVAKPTTTTTYTVTGIKNGCSSTASVTVTVRPDPYVTGKQSDWEWVYHTFSQGHSEIATDKEGNIFIIGTSHTDVAFGASYLESINKGYTYIAKIRADGTVLWLKRAIDDPFTVKLSGAVVDADGNLYISGQKGGSSYATSPKFIAKYDKDGLELMIKQFPPGEWEFATGMAMSKEGNIYIGGHFYDNTTIGPLSLKSAAYLSKNAFLAKFDASGEPVWVRQSNMNPYVSSMGVAVDADENCFMVGNFMGNIGFGSVHLNGHARSVYDRLTDGYIVKYDASGNELWGHVVSGPANDEVTAVATDAAGNAYAIGSFKEETLFGSETVTSEKFSNNSANGFFAKWSSTGDLHWVRQAKSDGYLNYNVPVAIDFKQLRTDSKGLVYVAGRFTHTISIGTHKVFTNNSGLSTSQADIFIGTYDTNGNALGVVRAECKSAEFDMMPDPNGNIYLLGASYGITDFGNAMTLDFPWSSFGFLAKLRSVTTLPFPTITTGSIANLQFCSGTTFDVPFTTTNFSNNNTLFKVELSDAKGSFLNPTTLGSGTTSPIRATIYNSIFYGEGYRIRVSASSPYIAGAANEDDLNIVGALPEQLYFDGRLLPCPEQTILKYKTPPVPGAVSYNWIVTSGFEITEGQGTTEVTVKATAVAGKITIKVTNACGASSEATGDIFRQTPPAPKVVMNSSCSDYTLWFTATGANLGYYYRWYATATGGTPLSFDQTYQTSRINALPVYYVAIISNSDCEGPRTPVYTCNYTSLPESKLAANLVVHPNPAKSDLSIELPLSKATALTIRLFDAQGRKLLEQEHARVSGDFKQVLNLRNKATGIYLLQLVLDDGVITKRVVVE